MAKLRHEDLGREIADEQLADLEERLGNLYTKATYELDEKLSSHFAKYAEKDADMLQQLKDGKITNAEYEKWRNGTIIGQESWFNMRDRIAQDLTHVDQIAAGMINDELPSVYASSYNFGAFMMENQSAVAGVDLTPFTIYNTEAVKMLMKDDPDLLPSLAFDRNKDLQWNRQHIQSAIAQGIIQGDDMNTIAGRLERVTAMDKNAAIRNARTATNGAENAGRQAIADECAEQGIPMVKEWNAVIDARTRDSHLIMDGEQVAEDERFSNGLMYAGDPSGDPEEVYNCRCATRHFIKGIDHSSDMDKYWEMMKEDNYEDWLRIKEAEATEDTHQYVKQLEKEYATEKQENLREEKEMMRQLREGEITQKEFDEWKNKDWDMTIDADEVQRNIDELLGRNEKEEKQEEQAEEKEKEEIKKIPTIPYISDVSERYENDGRKMHYRDYEVNKVMQQFGMDKDEAEKALNTAMERLVDGADFGSRIETDNLISVLDDGRFKNQFETGTSGGALSYNARANCEEYVFGVPKDTPDSDKPTYGMMFPSADKLDSADIADFYRNGDGAWYGDCTVIYKKENIIDNTTITLGDSLDSQYRLGATLASDPVYTVSSKDYGGTQIVKASMDMSNDSNADYASHLIADTWSGYIEIQMHGVENHSIENIDRVVLNKNARNVDKLKEMLDDRKIPYTLI